MSKIQLILCYFAMTSLKNKYYKLPWTKENNPNGWIEPTTYCQLKCPGCYRGLDKKNHNPKHLKLDELKQQVAWFIENRNIHTLSIAGGEPLLYPKLNELISYAAQKGLKTLLYTNGIGLDEKKIKELIKANTTTILIHIDKFQNRTPNNSFEDVIKLQEQYCELFRKNKGVNLGFIQPLTSNCLKEVDKLNAFYSSNRDIVSLIVYVLYREVCWDHEQKPNIDTSITIEDAIKHLENSNYFKPSSYLHSIKSSNTPTWMFSYSIGTKNKALGFLDKSIVSLIHQRYFQKNNRYLFITRKNRIKLSGLFKIGFNSNIIKMLFKVLFIPNNIAKPLYFQTILINRGPEFSNGSWDLCDGCPDSMLYENKLVSSCILEEVKKDKKFNK